MAIIFRKPLFWTNIIAFIFAGWLIAGLAFGWTNPGSSPPGGGGAIGAGANAPTNSLYIDSGGRIGVGKTNPYQGDKKEFEASQIQRFPSGPAVSIQPVTP